MSPPPTLTIPANQAAVAAGVTPSGIIKGVALDEDGVLQVSISSTGGSATAANQTLQINQLANILTALGLVASEATSQEIRDAVTGLGAGSTLADLAGALAPLATEATSQSILTALATLSTLGTETTLAQVRDALTDKASSADIASVVGAIQDLGDGATLSAIVSALSDKATETTQLSVLAALAPLATVSTETTAQSILAALGPLAKTVDVAAVQSAVTDLGDGKTLADVYTALSSVATQATQAAIYTELQAQGVNIAAVVSTLTTIEDEVDEVEPILGEIRDRLPVELDDGRLRTTTEAPLLTARGYNVEVADGILFASRSTNGGSVTYQSATGTYDAAITTTSGSTAILIHNAPALARISKPNVLTLAGYFTNTTTTNVRVEWGAFGGVASSDTALQLVDAFGFYLENGVFGVFYRTSIGGGAYPGNTTNVPQSAFNYDKFNGAGPSGQTLVVADLANLGDYEVEYAWTGAWTIQFRLGGHILHEIDISDPVHAIASPLFRTPHMRIGVYARASGAATATTFKYVAGSVSTLGGGAPPISHVATSRSTPIGATSSTEVPVYAARVASTTRARRLLPSNMTVRAINQNMVFRVLVGPASAFTINGSWATPSNSVGTVMEENTTATTVSFTSNARQELRVFVDVTQKNGLEYADLADNFNELDRWVGINGEGEQVYMVITALAAAGSNGQAALVNLSMREIGR